MKINFGLHSKFRVLLTEVLPYEMPLIMDNLAFFHNMQDETTAKIFKDIFCSIGNEKWTIPFNYCVRFRGGEKSRGLSLMHPMKQLMWVDIYNEYFTYLLYLCSRSPFSLRYISEKSNCLIDEDRMVDDELCEEGMGAIELFDACWNKHYQSYFQYKKYNMIYKFFDGADYLRLEQKYSYMMQTDISKCFYHIYTHSIAWAIKGKKYTKDHLKNDYRELFEQRVDRLMQQCNYNETNGVIVGPEVSRIFAEIILQRIDIDVLETLKHNEHPLHLGTDYEIRRYVDDYFIYANSKENLTIIKNVLSDCLSAYRLDLNESKTIVMQRPFSTSKNEGKLELRALIREEISPFLSIDSDGRTKSLSSGIKLFERFAAKFRNIVHHYGLAYSDLTSFMLSLLRTRIKELSMIDGVISNNEILLALCEISFYVYSLDMYATVSHKICDIIFLLDKCVQKTDYPDMYRHELLGKIDRETQRCLLMSMQDRNKNEINLEAINLLLVVDRLLPFDIEADKVACMFNKKSFSGVEQSDFRQLNYFQIVTLLALMRNRDVFANWQQWLCDVILERYQNIDWKKYAEYSCLYLDVISCPYLDDSFKKDLIAKAENVKSGQAGKKYKEYKTIKRWFTDWDRNRNLGLLLEKKRYHFAYG